MNYFKQELIDQHCPEAKCIPAMKVWKLPEGKEHMYTKMCDSGDYFGETKIDGYWYEYEKTDNYDYLFSKTTSRTTGVLTNKIDNIPHIKEAFVNVPKNTIIIGEIYIPGGTSKNVTTIMGCKPEKAIERQREKGCVYFYIYDIIELEGEDLTNLGALDRYYKCKEVYDKYLSNYNFIKLADVFTENLAEKTVELLNAGEEGMVLKKKDAPYSPNKRPAWTTIKMKQKDTADVICLGFCDATMEYSGKLDIKPNYCGNEEDIASWKYWSQFEIDEMGNKTFIKHIPMNVKELNDNDNIVTYPVTKGFYYGWKTAIKIGAIDGMGNEVEIGTIASGLNDALREDFSINPEDYIGKVLRVDCMSLDKIEHTIRHGIFKGFRDDKDAKDCLIEDIF